MDVMDQAFTSQYSEPAAILHYDPKCSTHGTACNCWTSMCHLLHAVVSKIKEMSAHTGLMHDSFLTCSQCCQNRSKFEQYLRPGDLPSHPEANWIIEEDTEAVDGEISQAGGLSIQSSTASPAVFTWCAQEVQKADVVIVEAAEELKAVMRLFKNRHANLSRQICPSD